MLKYPEHPRPLPPPLDMPGAYAGGGGVTGVRNNLLFQLEQRTYCIHILHVLVNKAKHFHRVTGNRMHVGVVDCRQNFFPYSLSSIYICSGWIRNIKPFQNRPACSRTVHSKAQQTISYFLQHANTVTTV